MVFYMETSFTILKSPYYIFFTKFTYNEYIGPYILLHVVSKIWPPPGDLT